MSIYPYNFICMFISSLQGLISGLGKGLVGTVTKPVVGVLDLASETATAVRDSSRRYLYFFLMFHS